MADNTTVDNGDLTDYSVSDEELADGSKLQSVELHSESAGAKTKFGTASNPVRTNPTGSTAQPVTDNGGSLTVDGTVTVQDGGSSVSVDDGGGSITVDGTVAVTEPVSVDDNGGSLTVDAPTGTPVNVQIGDGTRQATVRDTGASDSLNVAIVDAAGAQITSFGGGSGASKTDDAAFGIGSDAVAPAGFLADEASTDPVDEGDVGLGRMDVNRRQLTRIVGATDANRLDVDGSGHAQVDIAAASVTVPVSDAGGSLTVDGSVTADTELPAAITPGDTDSNPTAPEVVSRLSAWTGSAWARIRSLLGDGVAASGSQNVSPMVFNGTNYDRMRGDAANGTDVDVTRLPALVAGTANIGDVDVLTVPAPLSTTGGGTEATAHRVTIANDSTGVLSVDDNGGSLTVDDGAGSLTVDGTVTANQGSAGTAWEVVGDVAHDAAAPANPVVVGAQMETQADSAPGTRAGADGDAVKLASTDGAIFVAGRGPQAIQFHDNEAGGSLNTDTSVHAAPGAGLSIYVTDIIFSIGAATASSIFLEEGATTVLGPFYLEAIAGRGMAIHFQTPKKITANTALTVTNTGSTTFSIEVLGFIAPG